MNEQGRDSRKGRHWRAKCHVRSARQEPQSAPANRASQCCRRAGNAPCQWRSGGRCSQREQTGKERSSRISRCRCFTGPGSAAKGTTVREVVLVNRRKMRSPARAVSPRQRIPVHRSKSSRSRSTRLKARLLNQATLSSARMSENASRSLLHSRQPQSKTNLHHSSRQPQSKTNLHHSGQQPQSKTSNLRGPPRPSKRRLPSLLMHRRVRVKARAAGKRSPTRRKTKAATEP